MHDEAVQFNFFFFAERTTRFIKFKFKSHSPAFLLLPRLFMYLYRPIGLSFLALVRCSTTVSTALALYHGYNYFYICPKSPYHSGSTTKKKKHQEKKTKAEADKESQPSATPLTFFSVLTIPLLRNRAEKRSCAKRRVSK